MYLVEIKPSARRRNGAVGEAVFAEGARRTFASREAADAWAAELAAAGSTVWIQDAPPHDRSPVDGYLVGRRAPWPATAPFETDQAELLPSAEAGTPFERRRE